MTTQFTCCCHHHLNSKTNNFLALRLYLVSSSKAIQIPSEGLRIWTRTKVLCIGVLCTLVITFDHDIDYVKLMMVMMMMRMRRMINFEWVEKWRVWFVGRWDVIVDYDASIDWEEEKQTPSMIAVVPLNNSSYRAHFQSKHHPMMVVNRKWFWIEVIYRGAYSDLQSWVH